MFRFLTAVIIPSLTAMLSSLCLMWGIQQFNGKLFTLSDDMITATFISLLLCSLVFAHLAWRQMPAPSVTPGMNNDDRRRLHRILTNCIPTAVAVCIGLAVVCFMGKVMGIPMSHDSAGHWFAWPFVVSMVVMHGVWVAAS